MKTHTLETAAQLLATDPTTVRHLIEDGTIPAAKIGRAWVMIEDDLAEYLRQRIRDQTAERIELASIGAKHRQKTEASKTTRYRGRLLPKLDATDGKIQQSPAAA